MVTVASGVPADEDRTDPMNCEANLRTMWNKHQDMAIAEWNGLVDSFNAKNRKKGG